MPLPSSEVTHGDDATPRELSVCGCCRCCRLSLLLHALLLHARTFVSYAHPYIHLHRHPGTATSGSAGTSLRQQELLQLARLLLRGPLYRQSNHTAGNQEHTHRGMQRRRNAEAGCTQGWEWQGSNSSHRRSHEQACTLSVVGTWLSFIRTSFHVST